MNTIGLAGFRLAKNLTMVCKLVYVKSRGRAELIRFILAQAEVNYEDERISISEVQEAREATPYGILPVFHIDGKVLSGTATIARFLAEKHGLAGNNDVENAEIFGVIDATEDIWAKLIAYFYETNEDAKALMRTNILEKYIPASLVKLEKVVASNPSPGVWIYGEKMTYADFAIYVLMDVLKDHVQGILEKFPSMKKIFTAVGEQPNIQKWLAERPTTAT